MASAYSLLPPNSPNPMEKQRWFLQWKRTLTALFFVCLLLLCVIFVLVFKEEQTVQKYPNEYMTMCESVPESGSSIEFNGGLDCIRNATILDPVKGKWNGRFDIQIQNGRINRIESNIQDCKHSINVYGKIVTPGLVDMHSHMGLDTWPNLQGTDDTNEMTGPVQPYLRSMDAFNIHDPAIYLIATGGVTTSLVLPGSGNLMGGEAHVFKHRYPSSNRIEDMSIYSRGTGSSKRWRWMKMALGENPKRVYGSKGTSPQTRMGTAWLFRKRMEQASKLNLDQNIWCRKAKSLLETKTTSMDYVLDKLGPMPSDLELESLVALLRGNVRLNVHVYEEGDIETLFRISNEFNFTISAIHHGTSAYRVAEFLADQRATRHPDLTAALFADKGFYKVEAYHASTQAGKKMKESGIPVAMKSDHPVTNAQFLSFGAAKYGHYLYQGETMDVNQMQLDALRSVTTIPARAMGLSDRIGDFNIGSDADLVVWDGQPFVDVSALPGMVVIDGYPVVKVEGVDEPVNPKPIVAHSTPSSISLCQKIGRSRTKAFNLKIKNISSAHLNKTHVYHSNSNNLMELVIQINTDSDQLKFRSSDTIHVSSAEILCVGQACQVSNELPMLELDLNGGVVFPAPIAAMSSLGVIEVSQEKATSAGTISTASLFDPAPMSGGISIADGITWGLNNGAAEMGYSKALEIADRVGTVYSVSVPNAVSNQVVMGKSSLIRVQGGKGINMGIIQKEVGVHVQIAHFLKGGLLDGIHGQIDYLRSVLLRLEDRVQEKNTNNSFVRVLQGNLPLFVHVDQSEHIAAVLRLKSEFDQRNQRHIQLIIVGGAEAWTLASELATMNVSVILKPVFCTPSDFETRKCRSLSSLMHPTFQQNQGHNEDFELFTSGLSVLADAGVKIGLGIEESPDIGALPWIAGRAASLRNKNVDGSKSKLAIDIKESIHEAIGWMTWNLAEMMHLGNIGEILTKGDVNLVAYSGSNPLVDYSAQLSFTLSSSSSKNSSSIGKLVCSPLQV